MEYLILESNGTEIENIDGAALHNFISSERNGIIPGVLDECSVYSPNSTSVEIKAGEFLIQGFRVKIISPYQFLAMPTDNTVNHFIVASLTLNLDRSVVLRFEDRTGSPQLVTDKLFAQNTGTHELLLARYTTDRSGVMNPIRAAEVLHVVSPEMMSEAITNAIGVALNTEV